MKYLFFLCLGLSFIAALLGFGLLTGAAAAVFKCSFFGLFVAAMTIMARRRKAAKPVPSSYAASFPAEPEPASKAS
jgi:uncharacterized membrane protein YtjA (UPF0391 family)